MTAVPVWTYEVHELSEGFSAIVYDETGWMVADHLTEERAALIAAASELREAAREAEYVLDGIVEDEELGEECPRFEGFDLCGAKCCEQSGCIVERLARVRAALAKALPVTSREMDRG